MFLICGNRDLNKLRLPSELGAGDMARPASEIPDRTGTRARRRCIPT